MSLVIHNLRAGFATNSSSSHSVVIIPPQSVGRYRDIAAPTNGNGYGSQDFILASTEAKMRYLAAQLVYTLRPSDRDRYIAMFEPHVPNLRAIMPKNDRDYTGFYVDHQSAMTFPNGAPMDFVERLADIFKSDRTVIQGGSDGGTSLTVDGEPEPIFEALKESYYTRTRVEGGYLTIYNWETGNKVRLSADDLPPYTKAQAPELVDLKITDYCAAGCAFCYQSSTVKGAHAPFERIAKSITTLKQLGVFEVAIGGGEPTDHPDFDRIINLLGKEEITPNFTTFTDRWLASSSVVEAVNEHVRGIGVSVTNAKGLALAETIRAAFQNHWKAPKVMVQHVVGSVPMWVTTDLITTAFKAGFPVLLLGYKEVGFGGGYKRHDIGEDVPFMIKMALTPNASLSVDTALLDQYPTLPEMLGAPTALTTSPEGKFSCYIDAVTEQMAKSSYVRPEEMEPLRYDADEFKAVFSAY
jgi:hypothetical protein